MHAEGTNRSGKPKRAKAEAEGGRGGREGDTILRCAAVRAAADARAAAHGYKVYLVRVRRDTAQHSMGASAMC